MPPQPPQNPYGAPGPSTPVDWSGMDASLPMQGLGSLFQGLNQGINNGANLGLKIRGQNIEQDKLQNEMDWRKEQAGQMNQYRLAELAARHEANQNTADYRDAITDIKNRALDAKGNNAPAGQPIMDNGNLVGYTDGHGGLKMIGKGGAKAGNEDKVLTAIDQAAKQYGGLASDNRATAIPGMLGKAIARLDPNSEQSDYHRTLVNLASMLPKELSGRSNWPEIEAHMKNIPEFGPDKEKAAQYFSKLRDLVKPGATGAQPAQGGSQIYTYPSGRQAQWDGSKWVPK